MLSLYKFGSNERFSWLMRSIVTFACIGEWCIDVIQNRFFLNGLIQTNQVCERRRWNVRSKIKCSLITRQWRRKTFWNWDDGKILIDGTKTFDSICCSSLRGFLLDERKKDSKVPRLSGCISRDYNLTTRNKSDS
jgi:hypothetical protein